MLICRTLTGSPEHFQVILPLNFLYRQQQPHALHYTMEAHGDATDSEHAPAAALYCAGLYWELRLSETVLDCVPACSRLVRSKVHSGHSTD